MTIACGLTSNQECVSLSTHVENMYVDAFNPHGCRLKTFYIVTYIFTDAIRY